MTKEEAIKYLKQLYPNGGHCWLDEQRIEAIGMAIAALEQNCAASDVLEEAARKYAKSEYDSKCPATLPDRCKGCYAPIMYAFRNGALWKREQMMLYAVNATIDHPFTKDEFPCLFPDYRELKDFTKRHKLEDRQEVKLLIIKEDWV